MLGHRGKSFGGLLPSHCAALRQNLPEVVGLYTAVMPASEIPAFRGPQYWHERDMICSGLVAKANRPAAGFLDARHVLGGCGLPDSLLCESGDQLPKTRDAVAALLGQIRGPRDGESDADGEHKTDRA